MHNRWLGDVTLTYETDQKKKKRKKIEKGRQKERKRRKKKRDWMKRKEGKI